MPHILKNKDFEIHIDHPLEGYNHSRFDWTGKIKTVNYKGIPLAGFELENQGDDPNYGRGLFNEFGMNQPIGFDGTPEGDHFHKIGVGLLKKEGTHFDFLKRYEVIPASFEVIEQDQKLIIHCMAPEVRGYKYALRKEFILIDTGFEIRYTLHNNGKKEIMTDEYNHNFINMGGSTIGQDYSLKFPFELKSELFEEKVNPQSVVSISNHQMDFNHASDQHFFFSQLSGGNSVSASWTIENTKHQIGISETGDFECNKINVWGWKEVISPELFYHLHVLPGKTLTWSRKYQIYSL